MSIKKFLANFFRSSTRIHVHQSTDSVKDAIGVIDRFLDSKLRYELEWDDFISWENPVAGVEKLRQEIAELEPMFFSREMSDRYAAVERAVQIRNYYAKFNGIPERSNPYAEKAS